MINFPKALDQIKIDYKNKISPLVSEYNNMLTDVANKKQELIAKLLTIKEIDKEYKETVEMHFEQWELYNIKLKEYYEKNL